MMKMMIAAALLVGAQAYAANVLVEMDRDGGLYPMSAKLQVMDSGEVVYQAKDLVKRTEQNVVMATLSKATVARIQESLKYIPANVVLKDKNAGQPRCADAPGERVFVAVGGNTLLSVRERGGCHLLTVENGYADQLAELVEALASIAPN